MQRHGRRYGVEKNSRYRDERKMKQEKNESVILCQSYRIHGAYSFQ